MEADFRTLDARISALEHNLAAVRHVTAETQEHRANASPSSAGLGTTALHTVRAQVVRRAKSARMDAQETESQRDHYRALYQAYKDALVEILKSIMESEGFLFRIRVAARG